MPEMRAKMVVNSVNPSKDANGETICEFLAFNAVAKSEAYPDDGADEDNSYARWTPQAAMSMTINNPALFGKFKAGDKFYVDFTRVSE